MRKDLYLYIYILISIVCNALSFLSGQTEEALVVIGNCCTVVLFSYLFFDYKVNTKFTYSALFVLILFLFHFGQLMLQTFFSKSYEHIRFLLLLDVKESLYGFRVMTLSLSALCLGILWKSITYKVHNNNFAHYDINWIVFSKRIIYATFFVKLGLDIATLFISFTAGGEAARIFVNTFPNILLFYGKISMLGFAILLVALKQQPLKQTKLFLFIILYVLLMMMSGVRSENVGYLAVFLFIYLQSRLIHVKVKQVLLYGFCAFWGLTFIVAVGQFRDCKNKSLDAFLELSDNLLTKENVILGLFDTCGDTGYTAQEALNSYIPKYGVSYGDAYYKGIIAVIPNLFPQIIDLGKITEASSCPVKLQESKVLNPQYYNIGGSFFAELFMNFGVVGGVFMCFFWGAFFGWIGRVSAIAFETNNIYKLIFMIPLMLSTIYWVRSYFGGGVREAVWDIMLALFVFRNQIKR